MPRPEDAERHITTLAVWDVASPLVTGRRTTIKVGVKCASGCDLTGTGIEVLSDTGSKRGSGRLGSTPWPGTSALYWTGIDVTAPENDGSHSWSVKMAPADPPSPHDQGSSIFHVIAVNPPECCVTLTISGKDNVASGLSRKLQDVEVRLGAFRAATNQAGLATIEVPRGTYNLTAWKSGYEIASKTVDIADNTNIELELVVAADREEEYWM